MYTIAKGQTHLLQKSRRGPGIEGQKSGSPPPGLKLASPPPPDSKSIQDSMVGSLVFTTPQTSLDRRARKKEARRTRDKANSQEKEDLQVEEHRQLVSFLTSSWSKLLDSGELKYHEETNNPELSDFEPFNLDKWMEKKIYDAVMAGV